MHWVRNETRASGEEGVVGVREWSCLVGILSLLDLLVNLVEFCLSSK